MHPRIIAQRQAQAHGRVLAAVKGIAANLGIDAPDLASIREKSPDVQRVKEWEMLAEWTESLVAFSNAPKRRPADAVSEAEAKRIEVQRETADKPKQVTPAKAPKEKKDDDKK